MGEASISRGIVGPTGPTGAKGATGTVGPTGPTGTSGSCAIESQYVYSTSSTARTYYPVTFSFVPKFVYYIGNVDATETGSSSYKMHGILTNKGYGLWIKGSATSAPIAVITGAGDNTSSSTVKPYFYYGIYKIEMLVVAIG